MRSTLPVFLMLLSVSAVVYPVWTDSEVTTYFGSAALLLSLTFASVNLTTTRAAYSPFDPSRKAWARLATGTWIWLVGQLLESYSELVLHQIAYGTIADSFFLIGYLPLFSGLLLLIKDYQRTGMPMGNIRSYLPQALILIGIYGVVFYTLIGQQLSNPERRLALKFLDTFYPTLDFVLIALVSILIRISWTLRGGNLAKPWIFLCLGYLLLVVADIILGYTSDFQSPAFRFLDILYFSSFFLVALAGKYQLEMLRSER